MSRFFASSYNYDSGSSSSEEDLLSSSEEELLLSSSSEEESNDSFFDESENESENESDDSDSDSKPYGPDWFKKSEFRKSGGNGGNKFLKGANYSSSDEDSDDDNKKVVKSAKDKLLDEMHAAHDKIETAEMSDDWITILNEFDNINRLLVRAQQQNFGTPNIFVKVVAQVEELVNSVTDEIKNKAMSRAFNTVKQRARKTAKENSDLITKFKENPESFDKEPTVEVEIPQLSQAEINNKNQFAGKSLNLSSLASATSEASFFTTLRIVLDSRGKKGVDQKDLINILEELLTSAKSPYESIMAYLTLIPIRMDASSTLSYQPIDEWKSTYNDTVNLLAILDENIDKYQVSELATFNEDIEKEPEADANGVKKILGSIFSFVERLDDEFTKSLLNIDPYSSDYLERLRDEQTLYSLLLRVQLYFEATLPKENQERYLSRVFVKRLDHLYYKSIKLGGILEKNAWKDIPKKYSSAYIPYEADHDDSYIKTLVGTLSKILAEQDDEALRTRAILYQVYHTALNNGFEEAKEMLLTSKVQTYINKSGPSLQILFNRVVVQLGISAFQSCLIEECHQVLNDLLASAHLKEILGQQTLQRASNTDEEQQFLPYHQHINLDLIDVIFMTCSLLIEIPQMTAFFSGIKVKRIPYSQKSIRRALEHHDKSSFQGPPETSRDFVLYAAKSMQKGDWEKSIEYLTSIKAWNLLPNTETVLSNLKERIQVESLKTYFFTYKRFYTRLSTKKLSELFVLPEAKIVEILNSVITQYEINAKFSDDNSELLLERGDEITKLEEVALRLNKEYKISKERLHPSRR